MTANATTRTRTRFKRGRAKPMARQKTLAATKAAFALEAARANKLLGGERTRLLSARLDEALVAAAKERTGIESDTRLVELALASLAVGDQFGEWLVMQGGRLTADFDIDL